MSYEDMDDPRCPECGGAIGVTATYCMHCSADLTEERERADTSDDGYWNESTTDGSAATEPAPTDDRLLDPDGLLDDTLTTIVGLGGGLLVGVIGTVALLFITSSSWALLVAVPAWLVATFHLARQDTVHEAIARTAYGVAIVLLLVPFIVFGPSSEGTPLGDRIVVFLVMLGGVAIPAAIAAGIGYGVSRFVPGSE